MSNNMTIWDALRTPPEEAKKTITGGRLAGMTDIKPQWRYQAITEQFGPCGIGWKYIINRLWREDVGDGQVFAHAQISLYIKDGPEWSDAIPGIGGNMLVEQESKGLHASDEGYKMAVTDALSVAMKLIGVGSDVYMGNFATKYSNVKEDSKPQQDSGAKLPEDVVEAFKEICELEKASSMASADFWKTITVYNGKSQSTKEEFKERVMTYHEKGWKLAFVFPVLKRAQELVSGGVPNYSAPKNDLPF